MLGKTNAVHPGFGPLEIITRKISGKDYAYIQGTAYIPLRAQFLARGGSRKGYKFSYKFSLPSGLTLSEDGEISGIPLKSATSNGTSGLSVTDSEGNTASANTRFSISAYPLKWKVSDNEYVYDGQPHKVTIIPTNIPDIPGMSDEAKNLIQGVHYEATYMSGDLTETKAATYAITVRMLTLSLGYSAGSTNGVLKITASDDYTFNVQSETVKYDGQPHEIIPEIYSNFKSDDVIQYTTKYKGTGGTVYAETTTPPTAVGKYSVTIQTKVGNYKQRTKTVTLIITE